MAEWAKPSKKPGRRIAELVAAAHAEQARAAAAAGVVVGALAAAVKVFLVGATVAAVAEAVAASAAQDRDPIRHRMCPDLRPGADAKNCIGSPLLAAYKLVTFCHPLA